VILTWAFPFFVRVLGFAPPKAALTLGLITLVLSPLGVYTGGALADRFQRQGHRDATLRVGLIAAAGLFPFAVTATTVASPALTVILFAPLVFFASLSMGVAPAALQVVTPNAMRAQISATWMLVLNLLTASIGPYAVGLLNDQLFNDPLAVGKSIALVCGVCVPLGAVALLLCRPAFRDAAAEQSR
jgi:hypothetical protein